MPREEKQTPQPRFPLSEVRGLIAEGRVEIWSCALDDAENDFGWDSTKILEAFNQLQEKHFYKQDDSPKNRLLVMDFYKATIMNEKVYTHFYIDDAARQLVIQSFKRQ